MIVYRGRWDFYFAIFFPRVYIGLQTTDYDFSEIELFTIIDHRDSSSALKADKKDRNITQTPVESGRTWTAMHY